MLVVLEDKEKGSKMEVCCGNSKLMKRFGILSPEVQQQLLYLEQEGQTVVVLAVDKVPSLVLTLQEDHLCKPEAKFVVNFLQNKMRMRVCMITGDNEHAAKKVAKYLEIPEENINWSAYPETKRMIVEKYQEEGETVMFIGDGINDSPVLAQADIGCSINSASDLTVSAAGIVLIKDSLIDLWRAILISKKTFQRIKINFAFAFMYNVLLIPVAMGVFYPFEGFRLDPMYAAMAMALSSISVVTSSLLLKTYNPDKEISQTSGQSLSRIEPNSAEMSDITEMANISYNRTSSTVLL